MQTDVPPSDQPPPGSAPGLQFSWHHGVGNVSSYKRSSAVLSCPSPYPFPFPRTCPCEVLSEFSKGERKRDLGSTKCIMALAPPAWTCPCTWSGVCQARGEGFLLFHMDAVPWSGTYHILSIPSETWRNELGWHRVTHQLFKGLGGRAEFYNIHQPLRLGIISHLFFLKAKEFHSGNVCSHSVWQSSHLCSNICWS